MPGHPAKRYTPLRRRLLSALAANRAPGFHFPGYFLDIQWPRMGGGRLVETMPDGAQCRAADGGVALTAFSVLLDTALATAPRLVIKRGVRQATVHLHVQFTGQPVRGRLRASACLDGFSTGGTVREALSSASVHAGGRLVCRATGNFVVLPPPPGVKLAPLPWQRGGSAPRRALTEDELDPRERAILSAFETATQRADRQHTFIDHFWNALPEADEAGAHCDVAIGPQHGNRVGHVQGGLLLGLAAATAQKAAQRHPRLSAISAWFVRPGQGDRLAISARRFHEGRSFTGIRTEIRNVDGSLVLEVVSHHAA